MDEMQLVRDLYPEPAPPAARDLDQARALIAPPRSHRPHRPKLKLRWGLAAVAAAGAVAAVTLTLTSGTATPNPSPSAQGSSPAPQGTVTLDPQAAILLAATRAAQQPVGRYWHTDMVTGQSYILRPPTGAYAITAAATESFSWWGVKSGLGEAFWTRALAAGPATAKDMPAWHAAGSPSSFHVWSSDHYATYSAITTPWQPDHPSPAGGGDFADGKSAQDLQHLPADSAKLAKVYYSPAALAKAGLPPGASVSAKVALTAGMLGGAPLPPQVQAAFIRALAAQPGVHAIGYATDPLGRRGVALASDDHPVTVTGQFGAPKAEQGSYRSRQVLIFNPGTGALLAQEEQLTAPGGPYAQEPPGFVINYLAVRSAGWTNAKLTPPAQLPHR